MAFMCPKCAGDSGVINSRPDNHGMHSIRRMRQCKACAYRFVTFEFAGPPGGWIERISKLATLASDVTQRMHDIANICTGATETFTKVAEESEERDQHDKRHRRRMDPAKGRVRSEGSAEYP